MFGSEDLSASHLKHVAYLLNIYFGVKERRKDAVFHKVECLRHLQRLNETLRAAEAAALSTQWTDETGNETNETALSTLEFQLHELVALCARPAFFYSEATYSTVWNMTGRLNYFREILQTDLLAARQYWKKELVNGFLKATGLVLMKIELLLNITSDPTKARLVEVRDVSPILNKEVTV